MALTKESIAAKISKISNKQKSSGNGEFPKCSFLPEGNHVMRIITDPDDEILLEYYARGYFGSGIRDIKGVDKSELPENFTDELDTVAKRLSDLGIWKYNSKYVCLIYVWLISTTSENENWKPNNLYCVIGDRTFSKSIQSFLIGTNSDSPDYLQKMLNPNEKGLGVKISYERSKSKGDRPTCNVQPYIGKDFNPVICDEINFEGQGYKSLNYSYISPGFNQEKYDNLLNKAREDLRQKEAYRQSSKKDEKVKEEEEETLPEKPTNKKQEKPTKDLSKKDEDEVWGSIDDTNE